MWLLSTQPELHGCSHTGEKVVNVVSYSISIVYFEGTAWLYSYKVSNSCNSSHCDTILSYQSSPNAPKALLPQTPPTPSQHDLFSYWEEDENVQKYEYEPTTGCPLDNILRLPSE